MHSTRETILAALHARFLALPDTSLRGDVPSERVPVESLLILRNGKPGEPKGTLRPITKDQRSRCVRI